jgi:hypothetical protein
MNIPAGSIKKYICSQYIYVKHVLLSDLVSYTYRVNPVLARLKVLALPDQTDIQLPRT